MAQNKCDRRSLSVDASGPQSCPSAMKEYCQSLDGRDFDSSTAFVLAEIADRKWIIDP